MKFLHLVLCSGGSDSKASAYNAGRPKFNPWVGKILWRRKWQPTPVLLPGKSHGWRSLADYRWWGWKESDTTERLSHTYIQTYITMFQAQCKALYLLHCHLMRQVLSPPHTFFNYCLLCVCYGLDTVLCTLSILCPCFIVMALRDPSTFFVVAAPQGMWVSSLTRDRTCAPCNRNVEP